MSKTTLYIKNMVCRRCITAVEETLTKLKIPFSSVTLGRAVVENDNLDYGLLGKELEKIGFELITDEKEKLSENIKNLIVSYIHHNNNDVLDINFSVFLSEKTGKEYSYISKLFSEHEGVTIERYIILQKIERVKELVSYNQLNFSEIAFLLNYSSPAHLSKQFKDITGMTLSEYKKKTDKQRNTIDKL